jgi:hypothetical protein
MLLKELFESGSKHITFCFGRMNPPTMGHAEVFKTMSEQGGEMKIFLSQSQDKKKNPLDYSDKVKFIKSMFPEYASDVVEDSSLNTVVKVASHLYDLGYRSATFVAGSDRLEDMKKLLEAYNGVEGKAHGFYDFEVLDFKSSGEREDGAEGVAGVSASGARAAAANSDLDAFREATGAGELSQKLYDAVRKGMGINEDLSEAPIEMDPADPMDPMIYGHDKANPGKLKYRMARAAGQLKDLASRVDGASPSEWQRMAQQFEELKMNMEQIRHALEELGKVRKKGGIRSRGITVDSADFSSASEWVPQWNKTKTDTDIRTFQGYQMKFADDGLKIYKDGELVFKRDGDFSNPTNKQVVVGKMAVSRLIDQKKRKNES